MKMKCIMFLFAAVLIAAEKPDPQAYFSKHMGAKAFFELVTTSLPSGADCALVFRDADAKVYHAYIEKIKRSAMRPPRDETFVDIAIETFSTEDIREGKGNYAGGMTGIVDRLKSGVVFYKVSLLREKGAEHGVAWKYWVYADGKWLYFPGMYDAFKE